MWNIFRLLKYIGFPNKRSQQESVFILPKRADDLEFSLEEREGGGRACKWGTGDVVLLKGTFELFNYR